jgi:D,D-heptose 1,7-bisphosphate phosphatase
MDAVILAGGKGTRLGELAAAIPKPMIPIGGKPVLQHQIEMLKDSGIDRLFLMTGHLGNIIQDYFSDGARFSMEIHHIREDMPLGTAGCIEQISSEFSDDFVLLYGDVMMSMDITQMVKFHKNKNSIATLAVHPNDHPYDSDLVQIDDAGKVTRFYAKPHAGEKFYPNLVSAGAYVLSPEIFRFIKKGFADFTKDVFVPMITNGSAIYAYRTTEYLKDMGTPERLKKVEHHFTNGLIKAKNKRGKQRAVFLDRDGTINRFAGLVDNPAKLELLPFASEAIRLLNNSVYLTICVTNQPVIARNLCSFEMLSDIHWKLDMLLGERHAFLDHLYFCPHHPDKGYPEERPEFKIDCDCRKPKPGLVYKAMADYNIDLEESWMIGDQLSDIELGKNCNMKTILVKTGPDTGNGTTEPDVVADNLMVAVRHILETV